MSDRIYYSQEAAHTARRQRMMNALLFITLGLGIGSILALLFAPDDGEKTRDDISQALDEGFQRGRDAAHEAVQQLEGEFPEIRERVETAFQNIRS